MSSHRDTIREQFTKQAIPFSNAPGIKDEDALRLLVEFTGAGPQDVVLDVACGPGLGEMEGLLQRSFPEPGNAAKIRRILLDSLADDALGIGTHPQGNEVHFVYPVAILMARR